MIDLKNIRYKLASKAAAFLLPALSLLPLSAQAYNIPVGDKEGSFMGVDVQNISQSERGYLVIDLQIDLRLVDVKSQLEQVFTPYFYNGSDTIRFESFALTGRNRLLSNERNNRLIPITFYKGQLTPEMPATGRVEGWGYKLSYPEGGRLRTLPIYDLSYTAPWETWMENATFSIDSEVHGCANCIKVIDGLSEEALPLAQTNYVQLSYFPEFLYVTPVAEAVKMREISARAYIDFVVNRTEINPTYRRNPQELAKIRATIDSVRNDKDISITSLHISGTASPEGSYQNNVRLAKGRTESLKEYVQGLYKFPPGLITSSYEPVDWQGLAAYLHQVIGIKDEALGRDSIRQDQFQANKEFAATDGSWQEIRKELPHAEQILAIVDSDIEPYQRNSKIKTTYPKEYAWLLANVYPALRHSDYRIEFEIKHFTEAEEIIEIMQTQPQKLSLEELFVAANSQEPGSDLFNRAFEIAVAMYPQDETANINAATAAMQRGDIEGAQRFLSKVYNYSPEADYTKAMLELMKGNKEQALKMFSTLAGSTNPEVAQKARAAMEGYERVERENGFHFKKVE